MIMCPRVCLRCCLTIAFRLTSSFIPVAGIADALRNHLLEKQGYHDTTKCSKNYKMNVSKFYPSLSPFCERKAVMNLPLSEGKSNPAAKC